MLIRARPTAGRWAGFSLSLLFALCMVPLASADLWGPPALSPSGRVGRFTVRLPEVAVYRDLVAPPLVEFRRPVYAAGTQLDPKRDAPLVHALEARRRPPARGLLLGLGLAYFLLALLYTAYLRNFDQSGGHRGRQLRTQAVLLGALLATAFAAKAFLMFTALPVFLFGLGALSLAVAAHHDRQVAFATTLAGALLVASLVPFDLTAALVLATQGMGAVLLLRRPPRQRHLVLAGLGGGLCAATVYVALRFLVQGHLPLGDASAPATVGLLATLGGGVVAGGIALLLAPALAWALGYVSRARLIDLANFNHPLLRQIAARAPGTWAHSLAMANMAEVAATAIGADALLTRVGAYYHDLGKSLHPEYYIENMVPGEPSPHESMAPDESAQAIFAHCADGVRLGRQGHLPEPVLDFMHMHHGNGLLEYFWHKNQQLGNPRGLSEREFRYPGIPPQNKETAILAICDAVEASSRTLKDPDERSLANLVQRIVFGKLRLGQLDDSGLTSSDLKQLSNSLIDTLKSSFHVRIEYPWQKEEREAAAAATDGPTGDDKDGQALASGPVVVGTVSETLPLTATQRLVIERLDSADAPRLPAGTPRPVSMRPRGPGSDGN